MRFRFILSFLVIDCCFNGFWLVLVSVCRNGLAGGRECVGREVEVEGEEGRKWVRSGSLWIVGFLDFLGK